jgi:PAS domain S-box-containing protein
VVYRTRIRRRIGAPVDWPLEGLFVLTIESPAVVAAPVGSDHFVQFYDKDAQLLDAVVDHLDAALRAGGLAIAIATPAHLAELSRGLGGFGGPAGRASTWFSGSVAFLDARKSLNAFMVDGSPDPTRFAALIEPLLAKAPPHKPVHAFGEMVALLCEDGEYEAAVALEALWNDLAARHRFSLMCGYARRLFSSKDKALAFRHVCAAHGRVDAFSELELATPKPDEDLPRLRQEVLALRAEIQDRTHAEQTLRKRARELAEFLENASEGIHKVAADGTVLYANRAELEMLGYEWQEYVGHNIAEFYVDQGLIGDVLARLRRGEVLRDQPAVLRSKDGTLRPVLVYSNGYFEDGRLIYTRCFTRDASERVARDQALEQRNNLILQSPVATALLCGPELRFDLANEAYSHMVGRANVEGRTFAEVFPELRGSATEQMLHKVLETGEPHCEDEYTLPIDVGAGLEQRFFKLVLQPLRTPRGTSAGIIVMAVDVTEQVRVRQAMERASVEREQLLESLREASRAKDEFLAMLGHELRNPLSPIVTALQLMRMRGDTESVREQAIIQRQVDHMVRLIDDLLDISRITRGKIELKRELVQLPAVLTKAVEQASVLLEQRSHRMQVEIEPGLQCQCDPVRLAQVVANLLTNAARYTDVGGEIRLRAWRMDAKRIAISVQDNGSGLAPEVLPRIFDLFYQGERGIDRAEGGLGIGLALVRSLVQLHGGEVQARSEGKGRGSEFTVTLPAVQPLQEEALTVSADQPVKHASSTGRILLIDDNADAAETMALLLGHHGYEVKMFTDPVRALAKLPELEPQTAILDIGLPVVDGYELAARIRQCCGRSCLLIALTGYGQETDRARSAAAGFDHHLVKPVDPEQLMAVLQAPRPGA